MTLLTCICVTSIRSCQQCTSKITSIYNKSISP